MTRSPTRRAAALSLVGLVGAVLLGVAGPGLAGSAPASAAPRTQAPEDPAPLEVSIRRLTPSVVPEKGRVTVAGRIVNQSDAVWRNLKAYLLISTEPITTPAELAEATASDPETEIGERIVTPGLYDLLPDLDPGESTPFRVSVPRDELGITGDPGVYWLGVHVLGADDAGRIEGADGRARTFLPLVPPGTDSTPLALGMQFRNHVVRAPTGELQYLPYWQQAFTSSGRFGRLLDLSRTARGFPLAWVVDPDVLQAATSVVQGNPATSLTTDPGETAEEQATQDDEQQQEDQAEADPPPGARQTERWLSRFDRGADDHTVLALPFADLDASAAVRAGASDLLTRAFGESAEALEARGISSRPLAAPLTGYLSPEALAALAPDVPAALAPAAVPDLAASGSPVANRTDGGRLLVTPSRGSLFGPAPGDTKAALAVRQRLLAEVALHALSPQADSPTVALLPPGWDPGAGWRAAKFFRGLEQPWIQPRSLGGVIDGTVDEEVDPASDVVYPEAEVEAELPTYVVLTAQGVFADSVTLQELLTDETFVGDRLDAMALLGVSTWSRPFPGVAAERLRGVRDQIEGWLDLVTIRGPSFVTMSSEDGAFPITIVNGLDQPITVGLRTSVTGGALKLVTPGPVELPPGGRRGLRIEATSSDIGIHQVVVEPVTTSGKIVGQGTTLSVRSSKVGLIVWVIMGVGAGILFVAIVLRIARRIGARRRAGATR